MGAVPAGLILAGKLDDLTKIVKPISRDGGLNTTVEVAFIGLIAYFEAFCRDHFASLINICPILVDRLKAHNRDISIDAHHLLRLSEPTRRVVGFLLAERYDFGTAKSVNSLYFDLLGVTPFGKKQAKDFGELLDDRNLLVHHGGIYTARYSGQRLVTLEVRPRVFLDSLVLSPDHVLEAMAFLSNIARKMINSTHDALKSFLSGQNVGLAPAAKKALQALTWWISSFDASDA